ARRPGPPAAPPAPAPFAAGQACAGALGWIATVTLYEEPSARRMAKANGPSRATAKSSAPLLRSTRPEPCRPFTTPLTAYCGLCTTEHSTSTSTTSAPAITPEPLVTLQV